MPRWAIELTWFSAMIFGIVAGVLALYGIWLCIFRRERFASRLNGTWSARLAWLEVPVLVLVVSTCAVLLAQFSSGLMTQRLLPALLGKGIPDDRELKEMLMLLLHALPLVAGLLAIRWVPQRGWGLLLATCIVFGGSAWLFQHHVAVFESTSGEAPSWGDPDRIAIPSAANLTLRMGVAVGAIVAALIGYALVPRAWAFLVAGMVGGQLIVYASKADLSSLTIYSMEFRTSFKVSTWMSLVGPVLANLILVASLWLLPRQRVALLSAAGLMNEDHAAPRRLILRCAFCALTAITVGGIAILAKIEERTAAVLFAPKPAPRSPALVNAWGVMAEHFQRPIPPKRSVFPVAQIFNYPGVRKNDLHSESSFEVLREQITPEIRAAMAVEEKALAPLLEAYIAAGYADYLMSVEDGQFRNPSFLHLREVSRWLALRARVRSIDGDWKGALADIEALLRMSALEVDGNLVMQMIYTAIRGIGNNAGAFYWQAFRDNPEAMKALAVVMELTKGNRRSFPVDTLRRYEPGFGPIVPYSDIVVPSFLRASTIYQRNAAQFDMLRIATALELYRHDHGSYPMNLEALIPVYTDAIPPDAFDGEPLYYEVTEKALIIDTMRHRKEPVRRNDGLTKPLEFPLPVAADP